VPDIPDFTNHLFLWHLTPRRNADRIADQGFVPKGERRDGDPARPVWFSHSAFSFVQHIQQEKNRADYDGFLIALPIASLADWDGHAPDECLIFQSIPSDDILSRFPADLAQNREGLLAVLQGALGEDVTSRFTTLCLRNDVAWPNRTSPAAQVMYLDRSRYDREKLTALALADGLINTSSVECEALSERMAAIDLRFYGHFLRDYYFTYGERHLGRALIIAAARRLGRDTVADLCLNPATDPGHNHIARLIADIRGHLPTTDMTRSLIELRVARLGPNPELDKRLDEWILAQPDATDHARYFIERGGMPFHARYGQAAVELGARILASTEANTYPMLSKMTESPRPNIQLGATTSLGITRDHRAVPYLETCLESRWKRLREEAVRALGRIATKESLRAVRRAAAHDKTKKIRKLATQVLDEVDAPAE